MVTERYINPFTDFGFKKLFGEEPSKGLLLDFLSELLKSEQRPITQIKYLNNERLGGIESDRKAIFDIYCETETGEKFIVEIQKCKQKFFKDRTLFYSTFPIQDQGIRGSWNFELKSVYMIAILDFTFDEDGEYPDQYVYNVKLSDTETHRVFYDKLTFIYLTMPKFKKTESELNSHFDKWMYLIKNLPDLSERPKKFQEQVFDRLFETAEIAKLTRDEIMAYEDSLKHYRDIANTLDTAYIDGKAEGEAIGIEKGREEGEAIGIEKGRKEGESLGIEKGQAIGIEKGEAIGIEKRNRDFCFKLNKKGASVTEIAEMLDLTEGDVRRLLDRPEKS